VLEYLHSIQSKSTLASCGLSPYYIKSSGASPSSWSEAPKAILSFWHPFAKRQSNFCLAQIGLSMQKWYQ